MLRVKNRGTVIVHGVSGGVGTLAVQFARRRDARVIGTATFDRSLAPVRRLGAAPADGRREDPADAFRRLA